MATQTTIYEVYSIEDYNDWDHTIFKSAETFKRIHGAWPNLLLGNPELLEAFDLFMSKKLIQEGKIGAVTNIGVFQCSKFELQICLEVELPNHKFALVFDDEAEFIEEDASDETQAVRPAQQA